LIARGADRYRAPVLRPFLLLVIIVLSPLARAEGATPAELQAQYVSELATCLTRSGARVYGVSWCANCQQQLQMFGSAARLLPYVDCTHPNPFCDMAGVSAYPTWDLGESGRRSGVQTLQVLATLSGCDGKNGSTVPAP
jgi:hypothetical protein